MLRRKDLPDYLTYRGNRFAFSRLADGPSFGRLDPYAAGEQAWPMLNGHEIAVTAEEIRDITYQVYGITLPPIDPRDTSQLEARIAELERRLGEAPAPAPEPEPEPIAPVVMDEEPEAEPEPAPDLFDQPDPRDEALAAAEAELAALRARVAELEQAPLLPAPDALLSDWGEVGETDEDITGDVLLDAFERDETETAAVVQTLSALRLKHLSEQLNVERARLDREHQATGVANPRSASIDRLLGLLTRRGEV